MNNRELKFRIWCKGTSTNANFNKPRWIQPTDFILLKYYRCFQDVIESDDFIVQQYTGLKDRNGNDIYEGDLVRYEKEYTSVDKYSIIAPVVFSPFGHGFVLDSSRRHGIGDSKYGGYISLISPIVSDEKITYEVVGNIFENK